VASTPSQLKLELVALKAVGSLVIRDITDLAHPRTVQTFAAGSDVQEAGNIPQFVSASEISYFSHGTAQPGNLQDFAFVRTPLSGSRKTVVARPCLDSVGGSWNPDGTAMTYGATRQGDTYLHIVTRGRDRIVDSFAWDGGPYGPPTSPRYSTDGSYISWVGFGSFPTHVWTSDGKLAMASDPSSVKLALWSGDVLYIDGAKGIEKWRAGAISLFLPGVHWVDAGSSPAGGQIVYTVRAADGTGHVMIVDLTTGSTREIGRSRAYPRFLTANLLWYSQERRCAPTDPAGACTGKTIATGNTFVYDLQRGTESPSIVKAVFDVWPHGDRTDPPPAY
jgi:hypothetical protein